MSLITLYQSQIICKGLTSFAFSQSGQSPDLVAPTRFFTEGGATTAAFVNDPESPLARAAALIGLPPAHCPCRLLVLGDPRRRVPPAVRAAGR
jgi:fructoselysine-6-P-deglycase FrlB-like protein